MELGVDRIILVKVGPRSLVMTDMQYIPFYFVNNHRQVSTFGVWWEWIRVAAVYKCTSGQRSFYCKGEAAWNSLPGELRNYATFKSKNKLQALLFDEF